MAAHESMVFMLQDRAFVLMALACGLACAKIQTEGAGGVGVNPRSGSGGTTAFDAGPHDLITAGDVQGICQHDLQAVVRDFRSGEKDGQPKHPDFEYMVATDKGIVARMLGPEMKPDYAGGTAGTTTGRASFNQWYRDVDGVNIRFEITIPLTEDPARPGVYVFDSDAFYPIDNRGWGNQYLAHNQDFTTELHFDFPYRGGEVFTFRGDDDLFLFVNGILAIDLGGVHTAQSGSVDLDARAAELGLEAGKTYRIDIFQAERHCCESTFHIETTLLCVNNVVIP